MKISPLSVVVFALLTIASLSHSSMAGPRGGAGPGPGGARPGAGGANLGAPRTAPGIGGAAPRGNIGSGPNLNPGNLNPGKANGITDFSPGKNGPAAGSNRLNSFNNLKSDGPVNGRFDNGRLGDGKVNSQQLNEFLGEPKDRAERAQTVDRASTAQNRNQVQQNRQQWTRSVQGNVKQQMNALADDVFSPGWYANHPNAWQATHPHADAFAAATWSSAASWLAIAAAPVGYGYSDGGVVYEETYVYYNQDSQSPATAPDQQEQAAAAAALAAAGKTDTAKPGDWLSLGVFALVPDGQQTGNQVIQLAVSKDGKISGSYVDLLTGQGTPLLGAVDKESQHVAWSIGKSQNVVFETALNNLTQDSAPITIRYTDKQAQKWNLVRVNE